MSTKTLERRNARTRLRRIMRHRDDWSVRLPLQMELFLIAHDDETGRCYLNQRQMRTGLAAAVLLELWLTGRVQIGWRYHAREGVGAQEPGKVSILDLNPVGNPLTDAALHQLQLTNQKVTDFIREFATPDLYERVRADMIAHGVIRRATRRRFLLLRRQTYLPVHKRLPVRARGQLRELGSPPHHDDTGHATDHHAAALAGLVTALGLTRHLLASNPLELHRRLELTAHHHWAVRDITAALGHTHRTT